MTTTGGGEVIFCWEIPPGIGGGYPPPRTPNKNPPYTTGGAFFFTFGGGLLFGQCLNFFLPVSLQIPFFPGGLLFSDCVFFPVADFYSGPDETRALDLF